MKNLKEILKWDKMGTALVTGASAGIGLCFSEYLAKFGCNLILVARRENKLKQIAQRLSKTHNVKIEVIAADLTLEKDIQRIKNKINVTKHLDFLINNAGFGTRGDFLDVELDRHLTMNKLHVNAPTQLCYAVLPKMIKRNKGVIINLSSLATYVKTKSASVYCASKSYVRALSEVLAIELSDTNIKLQALCPGFTYTEFHEVGEWEDFNRSSIPKSLWMSADKVVEKSLKSLKRNKTVVVPGFVNRFAKTMIQLPLIGRLITKLVNKARTVDEVTQKK
ncbi:MAG: SDR family NAD(P)-dependent oxidoreductase [Candidatus Lokiarchaeota archaeon]|nr:SDR family NAD(P)-dependent oxidoreductase [Candidatus Lokiarchaeota archaeon]